MKTAVLLIAHGSERSGGRDSAALHSERIRAQTGYGVRTAYLFMGPGVEETVHGMMDDGIERIVAVPLLFSPGHLAWKTVRLKLGFAPGTDKGIIEYGGRKAEIVFTGTFGDHQKMRTVMVQTCDRYNAAPGKTSVLLIFRSSGKKEAETNAEYLRERGYEVLAAYDESGEPSVENALKELTAGDCDILAVPMFVSPGIRTCIGIPGKLGIPDERGVAFPLDNGRFLTYGEEIGMHPDITYILKDRISEALRSENPEEQSAFRRPGLRNRIKAASPCTAGA